MTNAIDLWHQCIENASLDPAMMTEDVVFYSPYIYTPIKGKTNVSSYLEAAGMVFLNSDFRYIEEIIGDNQACLVFEATFNDLYVNGVDYLVWNDQQKLTEIRVFIRPFQALNAIRELMAARL
tara:strand:+ start:56 stop:424 length:369 start_codon:yes stop_codon:yes gene_type:complete